MKLAKILELETPIWIDIPNTDGVRCQVVPSQALEMSTLIFRPMDDAVIDRICTKLFVSFDGIEGDDGNPIPNSLAMRKKLFNWPPCRNTILDKVNEVSNSVTEGNGSAVSDSDGSD